MGTQIILHSDLNCFYAAVEMNEHPELRGKAVAVCGSTENRHGIVLAKSYPAKEKGVKTGQANWEARQACPGLICVEPHYDQYMRYSKLVRSIYQRYSDDIEPFGMDENWISLTGLSSVEKDGYMVAEEIRKIVYEETGLTVSIGVSFSKIFAKLGSDMKKPNATTVITEENFREKVWPLPASDLLYIGRATTRKLALMNVRTIGDLAQFEPDLLANHFGKNGYMLWLFANGRDGARVKPQEFVAPVKSVGHGTTCIEDIDTEYAVWLVLYELAQDVGHRLRENKLAARAVQISIKDKDLYSEQFQMPLPAVSQSPYEIALAAYALFQERYRWLKPVRALTVRAINLVPDSQPVQLDLFQDHVRRERRKTLDDTIDAIRSRFGNRSIYAASLMGDLKMAQDKCETVMMPSLMYQ